MNTTTETKFNVGDSLLTIRRAVAGCDPSLRPLIGQIVRITTTTNVSLSEDNKKVTTQKIEYEVRTQGDQRHYITEPIESCGWYASKEDLIDAIKDFF